MSTRATGTRPSNNGDGVMALSGVVGAVCGDTGDPLTGWDLAGQRRQHGRVPHVAAGDPDGPNRRCLRVDPEVDLALDPPPGAAMLARMPRAFAR